MVLNLYQTAFVQGSLEGQGFPLHWNVSHINFALARPDPGRACPDCSQQALTPHMTHAERRAEGELRGTEASCGTPARHFSLIKSDTHTRQDEKAGELLNLVNYLFCFNSLATKKNCYNHSSPSMKNTMFNVRRPRISKIVFSSKKKKKPFEIMSQKTKPPFVSKGRVSATVHEHTRPPPRPAPGMLFQLSSHYIVKE